MNEKVNHGVNALWYNAMKDYKPYSDRLRSTNTKEFTRDTTLDRVIKPFVENDSVVQQEFIQDKILGS